MTDRELLEMSAKAAGIDIIFETLLDDSGTYRVRNITGLPQEFNQNAAPIWNPITDDADALRLAVKLEMMISSGYGMTIVCTEKGGENFMEFHKSDPYAATRRAIVREAAAIGQSL
jgi:hypothetical protein